MVPNASDLARRRLTVQTIVRIGSIGVLLFTVVPLMSWLAEGLADGDFFDLGYYADRIILAAFCPVLAAVIFALQRPMVRFLVPIRRHTECPACRHRIEGMDEPRCTECGLTLTPEFLGGPQERETRRRRAARVLDRREIAGAVLRVGGLFMVMHALLSWGTTLYYLLWVLDPANVNYSSWGAFIGVVVRAGISTLIALGLLTLARPLARIAVPFTEPAPGLADPPSYTPGSET